MIRAAFMLPLLLGGACSAQATAIPSLSCTFTEPFIGIDTFPGGMLWDRPGSRTIAKTTTLGGTVREPVVSGQLGTDQVRLSIKVRPGSDGMSDFIFPLTGLIRINGAPPYEGGCLRFPAGTTPRSVKVVGDDKLNVRKAGSARAEVVGRLGASSWFWAFPEPLVRGWARGAFARYPGSDSGKVTIGYGWVNARYLGQMTDGRPAPSSTNSLPPSAQRPAR